ncbi:MAG: cell wall hydrolase [Oliverpabstia sp.]
MKKLNQVLNFLRIYLIRTLKVHRHACIAVAAGTALIFTGTAIVFNRNSNVAEKKEVTEISTQEENNVQKEEIPSDDEDPVPRIPLGYQGIINGVLSSKGLKNSYQALGISCEMVLVGQRMIKTEVVSRLDMGSRLLQSVNALDTQSWELAGTTRMSDKDYENLLAIVEAEAGGEDLEGRIMVANVILNRVASDEFQNDVTSVIWERSGGSPQFSPTADGRIYTVTVSDKTREAVNRAIDGEDLSQGALYFIAKNQSEKDNVKWFEENLTFLFDHGGHSFYE